jgi:hypothetical protein
MDHNHPINQKDSEHAANDTGSINWSMLNREKLKFKRPPARRKQT